MAHKTLILNRKIFASLLSSNLINPNAVQVRSSHNDVVFRNVENNISAGVTLLPASGGTISFITQNSKTSTPIIRLWKELRSTSEGALRGSLDHIQTEGGAE